MVTVVIVEEEVLMVIVAEVVGEDMVEKSMVRVGDERGGGESKVGARVSMYRTWGDVEGPVAVECARRV